MGSRSGGSYAVDEGGAGQFRGNVQKIIDRFPVDAQGRFGVQPGKNRDVRRIYSAHPEKDARLFFETLGQGGSERPMPNGHGYMKWFSDGTHVSFRPTISRDGTPVIEITVASPGSKLAAYQKIHFVEGHKR